MGNARSWRIIQLISMASLIVFAQCLTDPGDDPATCGPGFKRNPVWHPTDNPNVVPCLACPSGTYSTILNSTTCDDCPRGFFSMGSASTCLPCSAGTYSSGQCLHGCSTDNSQTCIPCSIDDQCTPCPGGSYAPLPAMLMCFPCGTGRYRDLKSPATAELYCALCPEKHRCPYHATGDPIPCRTSEVSAKGSSECQSCRLPLNYSYDNGISCAPTPILTSVVMGIVGLLCLGLLCVCIPIWSRNIAWYSAQQEPTRRYADFVSVASDRSEDKVDPDDIKEDVMVDGGFTYHGF